MRAILEQRKPAALAFLSVGVLGLGFLLKPAPRKVPAPVISESEIMRLQRLSQRKSLQDLRSYFAGVAGDVSEHMVGLNAGISGIVWDRSRVVTSGPLESGAGARAVLRARGEELDTEVAASPPDLPIAVLKAPPGLRPVTRAAGALVPGDSIVIVWRRPGGEFLFAPGIFGGMGAASCEGFRAREIQANLPLHDGMAGAGVFDLDGGLVGVVLRCGGRYLAVAAGDVDACVERAASAAERMRDYYGLALDALDDPKRTYFSVKAGALVVEVWTARAAGRAGLFPGDVIVQANGVTMESPEQFMELARQAGGGDLEIVLRRGRTTTKAVLTARGEGKAQSAYGMTLETPPQGYPIMEVDSGGIAERHGIRAGDRLARIDGRRPASAAVARRTLSANGRLPRYLVVERGARRFGVLLD